MGISRREVMVGAAAVIAGCGTSGAAAPAPDAGSGGGGGGTGRARVFVVAETDRARAVEACLEAAAFAACKDKAVALKANFNSDDPFPASTHPDTLKALVAGLKKRGAKSITLGERSGMGDTRQVLTNTGAFALLDAAGAKAVVLDELGRDGWRRFEGEHWSKGFYMARMFSDAECVVQTMCCKTHRFGGHVTLALKNTIGVVAKRVPGEAHNYMTDLHQSSQQRAMIAEANKAWRPALNVMDCLHAFIDGGPESGTRVSPGVFLASDDRCALDATAIALLRVHGMKGPAASGPIGKTDQLVRAIALGIGAAPDKVDLVAVNAAAKQTVEKLRPLLAQR